MEIINYHPRFKGRLYSLMGEFVESQLLTSRLNINDGLAVQVNAITEFNLRNIGLGLDWCTLAVEEDVPIGFATAHLYRNNASKLMSIGVVEFSGVYVDLTCRGKGIGVSLDKRLIEIAKSDPQTRKLLVAVKEGNVCGEKLKRRVGFRPTRNTYNGEDGGIYRIFQRRP